MSVDYGTLPVFMRIGDGDERCIGTVVVVNKVVADNDVIAEVDLAGFFQKAADQLTKEKS